MADDNQISTSRQQLAGFAAAGLAAAVAVPAAAQTPGNLAQRDLPSAIAGAFQAESWAAFPTATAGLAGSCQEHVAKARPWREILCWHRLPGCPCWNMRFEGATLYSTRQPCGMCSMACIWAGISRIVYGAGRAQVHEMYFENRHLGLMDYVSDAFKDDLTVTGVVLAEDRARLYYGPDDDPPAEERANN